MTHRERTIARRALTGGQRLNSGLVRYMQDDLRDELDEEGLTRADEAELRDKVRSKIDVAKTLGGAITLTLGWAMTSAKIQTGGVKAQLAAVALLVSLALYLAAIDAYDTLLMPPRFWKRWARSFSAPLAIHDEMIRIWKGLFMPATGALSIGLVLLVWALLKPVWQTWAALAGGIAIVVTLNALFRPPMLGNSRHALERWMDSSQSRSSATGRR